LEEEHKVIAVHGMQSGCEAALGESNNEEVLVKVDSRLMANDF
jgi:hypothetical protein